MTDVSQYIDTVKIARSLGGSVAIAMDVSDFRCAPYVTENVRMTCRDVQLADAVFVVADKQDCYKGDVVAVVKHRGEHYSLSIEDYGMVIVRPSYLTVGGV